MSFPFYKQLNAMDCGPTCLRMIAKFYGKRIDGAKLRQHTGFGKEGVSLLGISDAAEFIGFRSRGVQLTLTSIVSETPLPCILHWGQNHFVVMPPQKIKKKGLVTIIDPSKGKIQYTRQEFLQQWGSSKDEEGEVLGIALLLEPTPQFYEQEDDIVKSVAWNQVFYYLKNNRWTLIQVFIALLLTSAFQLILPFLTQSMVDGGVNTQNLSYISIVLAAQAMLIFSKAIIEFIRSRLLLHISVRLNFSLMSDFWIKLTRLPLSYFDAHHTGDTLQRLGDSRKIESFLTGSALNTFFSLFNFLIFSVVLMMYEIRLLVIFFIGSFVYFIWIQFFLRIRRKFNYQNFALSAKENSVSLQLVQGMQELKLNNAESLKRWEWENVKAKIFKLTFKSLTYNQLQQIGAILINEAKNIFITLIVAQMVVQGDLTFGAMLAIQYIIGQLNSPIEQIVGFVQNAQDAKISMERLNEIHSLTDEEHLGRGDSGGIRYLPEDKSISFKDVSFSYPGNADHPVLQNIHLEISSGKTTAIVGVSGSGKTTLLKILLKFYENFDGSITIGNNVQFKFISPAFWRRHCGAVMQDGFIFNASIASNIAVGYEHPEFSRLIEAARMANILTFIESLPNGFNTKLGVDGVGISQGQKQRLLIARAIYKDPSFLFFDEATNALDANNEKMIVAQMETFFKNRTVVVVAHRLSTVKNADKIVVLDQGIIVEEGTHTELIEKKGTYYSLVKNQLELGN
jgi:ATP-binding cassette subfamily B protein